MQESCVVLYVPVTTSSRIHTIYIVTSALLLDDFIYPTRIMVQLSRNLSLRKLWHHFIEISFSRVQLQDSLNRYWASAMTNNGVSQSPPVSTHRISFDGKLTGNSCSPPRSFFAVLATGQSNSLKQNISHCPSSRLSGATATMKRIGTDSAR